METHRQTDSHTENSDTSITKDMSQHYTPLQQSDNQQRMSRYWAFWAQHDYLAGFIYRLCAFIIILGVLIALGLGLKYTDGLPSSEDFSNLQFDWKIDPSQTLRPYNRSFQYNVLLDGHTHTKYSDGKMNVRQLLDWHLANGYNAVIVTDHNTVKGGVEAEKLALAEYNQSIVVIPGMEYSCCRIHMNFIDINETVPVTGPNPTDQELQQVIQKVHALGGLVIVNHIPWSNTTEAGYQLPRLPNHPSIDQLISWGVDGFEIVNQDVFDMASYQAAAEHNLIQMVGMDLHHPSVGAQTWLTIQAPNMTRTAIMNEIRNRRTSFLFDPAGTRPRVYVDAPYSYKLLTPLLTLGDYFGMFYDDYKGMYSFQGTFCQPERLSVNGTVIGWFIFWIFLFVLSFEALRWAIVYAINKRRLKYHTT